MYSFVVKLILFSIGWCILLANLYIHVNNNCFNIFLRIHIIIIPDHSSKVRISRIETNGYDSETAKTGQLNLVFCSLPKANQSSRFDKKVYQKVIKKYKSINYRMSNATISRFNLVLTERWRHKSFFLNSESSSLCTSMQIQVYLNRQI